MAFCQNNDTAHAITIKVKRVNTPLTCVYSRSNTIYTNVTNVVRVNYSDTTNVHYELETELGFVRPLHDNFFMVVKHGAGSMLINIWKDSADGTRKMVSTQEFTVKSLPNAAIVVGDYPIDSTAYVSDLIAYKKLNLLFGDFTPMSDMCAIHSFDMKIDDITYHSESDTLTNDMIIAIKHTKNTIRLLNVKATINSADDVEQTLTADKKKRVLTQRVYNVEKESKPIVLMR